MASFLDIPEEVRGMIINKIPQNNIINLRLVCRQLNADVDNHYDHCIKKLDENLPQFKSIVKLRAKNLEVLRLVKTSVLMGPKKKIIFKFPNVIKTLRIGTHDDGRLYTGGKKRNNLISPSNLQALLIACSSSLEELTLELGRNIITSTFRWRQVYNFGNLKSIRIFVNKLQRKLPQHGKNPTSFLQQLSKSHMPKLVKLNLDFKLFGFSHQRKSEFLVTTLNFIVHVGTGLEKLKLQIYPKGYFESLLQLSQPNEYFPQIANELTVIKSRLTKLTSVWIREAPERLENENFWLQFICEQTNLEHVEMPHGFTLIPHYLCQQLLLNNYSTLSSVRIQTVTMEGALQPFDLAVFQVCMNLKYLRLNNQSGLDIPQGTQEVRHLINLAFLPPNLEVLYLSEFGVKSTDLLDAFGDGSTKKLRKLKGIRLNDCGSTGEYGVTGKVLGEMTSSSSSNLKRIWFPGSDNHEEQDLRTLKKLLVGFAVSCPAHYVILKKNDVDSQWVQDDPYFVW